MTRKDIEVFSRESASFGDVLAVMLCKRALEGDKAAWLIVKAMRDEARAREQEDLAW